MKHIKNSFVRVIAYNCGVSGSNLCCVIGNVESSVVVYWQCATQLQRRLLLGRLICECHFNSCCCCLATASTQTSTADSSDYGRLTVVISSNGIRTTSSTDGSDCFADFSWNFAVNLLYQHTVFCEPVVDFCQVDVQQTLEGFNRFATITEILQLQQYILSR